MSSGVPRRFVGIDAASRSPKFSTRTDGEVGLHQTGRDPDDPGRTDLGCQLTGEMDQCRLRDVVHPEAELGTHAAHGGDVDDDAGIDSFIHLRYTSWHQNSGPLRLTSNVLSYLRLVDLECRPVVRIRRSIVDEDVDPPESLERGVDARGRRLEVAGVGGEHGRLDRRSQRLPPPAGPACGCSASPCADVANPAAIALPMPFDAPVTSATLPSSEISMRAER